MAIIQQWLALWPRISAFSAAHRKGFRNVAISIFAVFSLLLLLYYRFWFEVLSQSLKDLEFLSGTPLLALIVAPFATVLPWLMEQLFRHRLTLQVLKEAAEMAFRRFGWTLATYAIIALLWIFLVVPPRIHKSKAEELKTAKKSISELQAKTNALSQTNAALIAEKKATYDEPLIKAITNEWRNTIEQYRLERGSASESYLKEIASRPTRVPALSDSGLRLSDIDAGTTALRDMRMKQIAKEQLTTIENAPRDAATLTNVAPRVDYYMAHFQSALAALAKRSGDTVVSTYKSAIELAEKPQGQDTAQVSFERHPNWVFQIIFRRVDGNARYNWLVSGRSVMEYKFEGEKFDYYLTGGGVELRGNGQISSLQDTNVFDMIRWFISTHRDANPLTNNIPMQ